MPPEGHCAWRESHTVKNQNLYDKGSEELPSAPLSSATEEQQGQNLGNRESQPPADTAPAEAIILDLHLHSCKK